MQLEKFNKKNWTQKVKKWSESPLFRIEEGENIKIHHKLVMEINFFSKLKNDYLFII